MLPLIPGPKGLWANSNKMPPLDILVLEYLVIGSHKEFEVGREEEEEKKVWDLKVWILFIMWGQVRELWAHPCMPCLIAKKGDAKRSYGKGSLKGGRGLLG